MLRKAQSPDEHKSLRGVEHGIVCAGYREIKIPVGHKTPDCGKTLGVEISRVLDRRRAQRENHGRRSGVQESFQGSVNSLPVLGLVIKRESRLERLRRPVGLRFSHERRKQCQYALRGVLPLENGI